MISRTGLQHFKFTRDRETGERIYLFTQENLEKEAIDTLYKYMASEEVFLGNKTVKVLKKRAEDFYYGKEVRTVNQ